MFRIIFLIVFMLLTGCVTNPPKSGESSNSDEDSYLLVVYAKAMKAYEQGDMVTAEAGLKKITEQLPKDAEAWFRLGNVYARTDRPDEAILAYREALVRNPEKTKAWHNMSIIYLRQALNSLNGLQNNTRKSDPEYKRAELFSTTILEMLDQGVEKEQESANNTNELHLKSSDGLNEE